MSVDTYGQAIGQKQENNHCGHWDKHRFWINVDHEHYENVDDNNDGDDDLWSGAHSILNGKTERQIHAITKSYRSKSFKC